MTEPQPFVRAVEEWLAGLAQGAPPPRLQSDVVAAARRIRQRRYRLGWSPDRSIETRASAMLLTAAARVILVAVVTINLLPRNGGPTGLSTASPSAPASPLPSPATSQGPAPTWVLSAGVPIAGNQYVDFHLTDVPGFGMGINVAAPGWYSDGRFGLQKGTGLTPSARVIFRGVAPQRIYSDPCSGRLGPAFSSAAELASAVASIPGTDASGPTHESVGFLAAKLIVLTIRENVPCEAAKFDLWPDERGNPRAVMQLGDTVRVWILDYRHLHMVNWVEAETRPDAGSDVEREIEEIVASITMPG